MALVPQIIAKKRDQHELSDDEIATIVDGIVQGSVPDYQVAAWAMAVLCRGMNARETATLTRAMLESGELLSRGSQRPRVDKHSTGGLGDKVSLVLAPLLACFEVEVPMLSGRGLGITGGTLDKLESYPGFRSDLDLDEIQHQLASIGCVITGTTADIAPADRKLYALRDVTATVPSVPLITASILSKKLAESLDVLVLDVKVGSGSFMKTLSEATELATSLVETSRSLGLRSSASITDMSQPLGLAVGNACEANESTQVLQGVGPADVRELTFHLAARILVNAGIVSDTDAAEQALAECLASGQALERYIQMIEHQGGKYVEQLPLSSPVYVGAKRAGWIQSIDGERIGQAVIQLGGGRRQQGDAINHQVGLELQSKVGDQVSQGQEIVKIYQADSPSANEAACTLIEDAIQVVESQVESPALIHQQA